MMLTAYVIYQCMQNDKDFQQWVHAPRPSEVLSEL
jgi:hypothetical protein